MKRYILLFVASFAIGFVGYANYLTYIASESPTFKPTFAIDYTDCGEISFPSSDGQYNLEMHLHHVVAELSLMKAILTFHRFVLQQT